MNRFTQGLLFGLGIGGLLGLLNTPHSGAENRRRLQAYLNENRASVDDLSQDLKGLQKSLAYLSEEGMAVADTATKELTQSVTDFAQKNQPRIKRVTDSLSKLTQDVQQEASKYQDSPLMQGKDKDKDSSPSN